MAKNRKPPPLPTKRVPQTQGPDFSKDQLAKMIFNPATMLLGPAFAGATPMVVPPKRNNNRKGR
jgi:hypothetical protein